MKSIAIILWVFLFSTLVSVKSEAICKENFKTTIYDYDLAILAKFSTESHVLKEWIEHHLLEGVQHFYLINQNSTDDFLTILQPYMDKNIVEVKTSIDNNDLSKNYNELFAEKCKRETKWLLVCNLDEFVYSTKKKRIIDYLNMLPGEVSQIYLFSKYFGSNSQIHQPKSVIKGFQKRINYNKKGGFQSVLLEHNPENSTCKYIVRTKHMVRLDTFKAFVSNKSIEITSNNKYISPYTIYHPINENFLRKNHLHMNHYFIQSLDWYQSVKITRESDNYPNKKNTVEYFYDCDKNCSDMYDRQLMKKRAKLIRNL